MNLTEYYLSIYPTKCPADTRFLASKEDLILTSRTIEDCMSSVKFGLANLSFWLLLSHVIFSFFMTPLFFLPLMGGTCVGLATDLGVPPIFQFYIISGLTSAMSISIVMQFENRSSLILKNRFRINGTRHRAYWFFGNFFAFMLPSTLYFLNLPDPDQARIDMLKTLPCPTKEFFTEPFFVLSVPGFWEDYLLTAASLLNLGFIVQILLFSSCCIYYLFIDKSSFASPETQKAQARSFIGIVLQTYSPILLVGLTLVASWRRVGIYDQVVNNFSYIFLDFHSGTASLSILFVQHPYRKFLISFFCKKKQIDPVIVVSKFSVSS